jgi:signal transduction histidine kinase
MPTTAKFFWDKTKTSSATPEKSVKRSKLSDEILISNIRWFILIRWGIIGALVLLKILAIYVPDTLMQFGVIEHEYWPVALVLVLSLANFSYFYALNHCKPSKLNSPSVNLWAQIIIDLLCLSIVVHYVGSTASPASFFYVLHIALACIFFSTRESLLVAIMVCVMYTLVLLLENSLLINVSQATLISPNFSADSQHRNSVLLWMVALDVLFLIVWYVVSRLSLVVRTHESHLRDAYQRINQAQVEKDQYAVLMTHQLKSPLDAIRSKINLINAGYCGDVSSEANETLIDIDRRAKTMSSLILDLLRLERLKETCLDTAELKPIDIKQTIQNCIDKLTPVANAKQIALNISVENFIYRGIPDQLEMLLENIIANAINYSHDNTTVEITSEIDQADSSANLTITDHGIGIESKDLPNIFNEYFYSPRAALHNKASSGIGLSIVKIAAENNKLQIKVASKPGVGTSFTVIFKGIQFPTDATED